MARGRIIALAKTTDFFIQNLLLRRKNSLFSGIPISRSCPEWCEVGTDEGGYLPADIFLIALVVALVVGIGVILAFLGLVLLHKDFLVQLTCEALQEILL